MEHATIDDPRYRMALRDSFRSYCKKNWWSATIPMGETVEYKAYYAGSQKHEWAILTMTASPDAPIIDIGFGCELGFNKLLNTCSDSSGQPLRAACHQLTYMHTKNATLCIWPQHV